MTIRCPRCGTIYRRPASAEQDADVRFRCARCRHVFVPGAEEAEEPAATVEAADDEAMRFAFDDPADEDPEDGEDEAESPARQQAPQDDDEPADDEDADETTTPAPAAPRIVTPARFALRALLGVTLGYAVLSVYLYTNPEVARRTLAPVPLLGPALLEARLSPANIQLAGVRGEYQRVKGDQLVFVITGTAINNAPLAVKGIQIEARIAGAEERRQVVFCGAALRDLRDLSLREIALLQTLEPPKDWTLGPGEQSDFLVAFAEPPAALREFSTEVLAVQASSRRSDGSAAPERWARPS